MNRVTKIVISITLIVFAGWLAVPFIQEGVQEIRNGYLTDLFISWRLVIFSALVVLGSVWGYIKIRSNLFRVVFVVFLAIFFTGALLKITYQDEYVIDQPLYDHFDGLAPSNKFSPGGFQRLVGWPYQYDLYDDSANLYCEIYLLGFLALSYFIHIPTFNIIKKRKTKG